MDIKFKTCVMKLFSIAFLLYMQMEIYSYFKEDPGYVIFSCNEMGMGILSDDLNNINLKDTNYKEDDIETIIHIRLLAWHIHFEALKCKALKRDLNEEIMLIAWHPIRLWNFCMSEDEKKEVESIFLSNTCIQFETIKT